MQELMSGWGYCDQTGNHVVHVDSGVCQRCGKKVQPSTAERVDALEAVVKDIAETMAQMAGKLSELFKELAE